jgi:DNA-binding CsgD family transcriptional regulator
MREIWNWRNDFKGIFDQAALLDLEHLFYYNTCMSIWQRFLFLIGLRPNPGPRKYEISEGLQVTLSTIARHEGRPEHELFPELLAAGLDQYRSVDELWPKWQSLSPREQDVTALCCLGFTNRQIAARLSLSPETIKTHVRNILLKFGIKSKSELRHILASWDFDAWL